MARTDEDAGPPPEPEHDASETTDKLDRLRRRFLIATSAAGVLSAAVFVFINTARQQPMLVAGDVVLILLLAGNIVLLRRRPGLLVPAVVAVSSVAGFLGITMQLRIVQPYLWTYVVPGAVFFTVGLRRGIVINAGLAGLLVLALFTWPPQRVTGGVEISILLSFVFVWALAYLYERTRLEYELDLRRLSVTDALTRAGNRRHLDQALKLECARASRYGRPLSLIIFDVDRFKSINDQAGHRAGDHLLIELVELLRPRLRQLDVFARLGGDEFVVLLPETPSGQDPAGPGGAVTIAERMRAAVAGHAFRGGISTSITLGVAELRPGDDPAILLERADAALYEAKREGRNRVRAA